MEEIIEILQYDENSDELVVKTSFMEHGGKLKPGESRFLRSLSKEENTELKNKAKEFMEFL